MAYKDSFTKNEEAAKRAGRASGAAGGRATGAAKGGGWGTAGGAILGGVGGFFLGGPTGAFKGAKAGAAVGGAAGAYFGGKSGAKKGAVTGANRGIRAGRREFQRDYKANKAKKLAAGLKARSAIEDANSKARMTDDQLLSEATLPAPRTARGGSRSQRYKN
jgi:hypothetical protein